MENLKYTLVTLKNGKEYFVLESVLYEYDTYNLVLNVEDENDICIVLQEVKNGKTIFTTVDDKNILKNLSTIFEENIRNKQASIN